MDGGVKHLKLLKIIAVTIVMFVGIFNVKVVYASEGWVDDPAGIYNNNAESNSSVTLSDPKFPETWIINILKAPAKLIQNLETAVGMNLNQVVFGRVAEDGKSVNYFKFELTKGNFYGTVGAYIYNIFRSICIVILWSIFAGQMLKMLIMNNSSKVREEFKASISKMIIITIMFYLMPYIWQIAQYIFDVLLYIIYQIQGALSINGMITGTDDISIAAAGIMQNGDGSFSGGVTAVFEVMADKSWICALVYLGSTILSLYFAYSYISLAMAMFIYFILFTAVCCTSYLDKNVLNNWVKNVISGMMVPVIDATLLLLPATAFGFLKNVNIVFCAIVTIIICALIIPCRSLIKGLLGINMGGIAALTSASGLSAIAMMHGAKMLKSGVENAVLHRRNAKEANQQADMYEEMARAESGGNKVAADTQMLIESKEDNTVVGNFNRGQESSVNAGSATENGKFSMANDSISFVDNENKAVGADDTASYMGDYQSDGLADGQAGNSQIRKENMYGYLHGDFKTASNVARTQASYAGQKAKEYRQQAQFDRQKMSDNKDAMSRILQISQIDPKKSNPIMGKDGFGNDIVVGYEGMDNSQREQYENAALGYETAHNSYIENTQKANDYENIQGQYGSVASEIQQDMSNWDYNLAETKQQIVDKYANINTVNRPSFNNVSSARKAELLREYAKRENRRAVSAAVGTAYGMSLGFGATAFMSPTATVMAMGAGSTIGSSLGSKIGDVEYKISNSVPVKALKTPVDEAYTSLSGSEIYRPVNQVANTINAARQSYNEASINLDKGFQERREQRAYNAGKSGTLFGNTHDNNVNSDLAGEGDE